MNREAAGEVFIEGCGIAESLGLTWWVSAGTCLGLYRDGDFCVGDTDVDIAMLYREGLESELRQAYTAAGFHVYGSFDVDNLQLQLVFDKSGIIFDIYFNRDHGEDDYYQEGCNGKTIMPRWMYQNRTWIHTKYGLLPFPKFVETYLQGRYGETWKIPQEGSKPVFT